MIEMKLDANYQPLRRYVYGAGMDDVEGYVEFSELGGSVFDESKKGWYTYVKDQVGTVYKVYSDYARQIVDTRVYDTFGNLINRTGSSSSNPGFQGKYFDGESSLYYFYHRYYHTVNGRFNTEDPLGIKFDLDKNLYLFVKNNPLNLIDPLGFAPRPYEPSECCKEKEDLKNRLELIKWFLQYWKSKPTPTSQPTHGPKGKSLVPFGEPDGWTRPGLQKCIKKCTDIHETVPSHRNCGSLSLAASEMQGYLYEKWCLEYELGLVNYWKFPF